MNRGGYLEAQTQEFRESKAKVWQDESPSWQQKQSELDRSWREFDMHRNALQ